MIFIYVLAFLILFPIVMTLFNGLVWKDNSAKPAGENSAPQRSPVIGTPPIQASDFDTELDRRIDVISNHLNNRTYTIMDASLLPLPIGEIEEALASYYIYLHVLRTEHPSRYEALDGKKFGDYAVATLSHMEAYSEIEPSDQPRVDSINLGRTDDPNKGLVNFLLDRPYYRKRLNDCQKNANGAIARHWNSTISRYSKDPTKYGSNPPADLLLPEETCRST